MVFAKDCVHKGRRSNTFVAMRVYFGYMCFSVFSVAPVRPDTHTGHVRQHLLGVCFSAALHNSNFSMVTCSLLSRLL